MLFEKNCGVTDAECLCACLCLVCKNKGCIFHQGGLHTQLSLCNSLCTKSLYRTPPTWTFWSFLTTWVAEILFSYCPHRSHKSAQSILLWLPTIHSLHPRKPSKRWHPTAPALHPEATAATDVFPSSQMWDRLTTVEEVVFRCIELV